MQETWVQSLAGEDPPEKGKAPVFRPGECHRLYSPWPTESNRSARLSLSYCLNTCIQNSTWEHWTLFEARSSVALASRPPVPRGGAATASTQESVRGPSGFGGGRGLETPQPEARGRERGAWAGSAQGGGGSPWPKGGARRPVRVLWLSAAPWGLRGAAFGDRAPRGRVRELGGSGARGLRCSSRAPAAAEFAGERACAPGGGGVGTGAFWLLIFSQVEETRPGEKKKKKKICFGFEDLEYPMIPHVLN